MFLSNYKKLGDLTFEITLVHCMLCVRFQLLQLSCVLFKFK